MGQFLLVFAEDGATLTLQSQGEAAMPPCVVAVQMSGPRGAVTRKLGFVFFGVWPKF